MVEALTIALISPTYAFLITITVELFRIERILGAHTETIRGLDERVRGLDGSVRNLDERVKGLEATIRR